jgi:hypothetical protein
MNNGSNYVIDYNLAIIRVILNIIIQQKNIEKINFSLI